MIACIQLRHHSAIASIILSVLAVSLMGVSGDELAEIDVKARESLFARLTWIV